MIKTSQIWKDGLWYNNAGFVQLLGLCPLLAVSSTVVNSLGLGLATLITLVISNVTVSLFRHQITAEIRIPAFVIIIAAAVSCVEMIMQAYQFELYLRLGIFVPLIVTNCAILGRAEAFASRQTVSASIHDALATGLGFAGILIVMGATRELIGYGSLFRNMDQLLGDWASSLTLQFNSQSNLEGSGFLLALLPPGAFIILGLLIAARNAQQQRHRNKTTQEIHTQGSPSTR